MSHRIVLTVDGESRTLLTYHHNYYRQKGKMKSFDTQSFFNTPIACDLRNGYRFDDFEHFSEPLAQVFGGMFYVSFEATDKDDLFYYWMKNSAVLDGRIEFFRTVDEDDIPFQRINFWDAFLVRIKEQAAQGIVPMTMECDISAAIVRHNRNDATLLRKSWYVTNIDEKPISGNNEEEEEEVVEPKCTLYFRRPKNYKGEFGFDWLRGGDTGEFGDTWYKNLLQPLDNGKTSVQQYDELVSNHFTHFKESWKKDHQKYNKNYTYVVPVMTLLPPVNGKIHSAELRLKLEVEEQWNEGVIIEFENSSDGQYLDLNGFNKVDTPKIGVYYYPKNLTITCTKAFPHDIDLVAKAGNTVVGKLKVLKNSTLYSIKLAIIKAHTINHLGSNEQLDLDNNMIDSLKNILGQAYIVPEIEYLTLDLSKSAKVKKVRENGKWIYRATYQTQAGIRGFDIQDKKIKKNGEDSYIAPPAFNSFFRNNSEEKVNTNSDFGKRNYGSIHKFLDMNLIDQHPHITQASTYRLYLINIKGNVSGQAEDIPSKAAIICSEGYNETTPAHELFHCLSLHHPFHSDGKTPYCFTRKKTDNNMDYDEDDDTNSPEGMNIDNRYSLWHWQLKLLWQHLKY